MMEKPFVIAQVSWLTKVPGNEHRRDAIVRHFYSISKFLQDRGLATRHLVGDIREIDDTFSISSTDVTEEGLAVIRMAYDRWLRKVDRGMNPSDVSLLDQALRRIRESREAG